METVSLLEVKLKKLSPGKDLYSMNFCPNTNVEQWLAVTL